MEFAYPNSRVILKDINLMTHKDELVAIVVALYGIFFTRNLTDVARKKYVVEEGVFAA